MVQAPVRGFLDVRSDFLDAVERVDFFRSALQLISAQEAGTKEAESALAYFRNLMPEDLNVSVIAWLRTQERVAKDERGELLNSLFAGFGPQAIADPFLQEFETPDLRALSQSPAALTTVEIGGAFFSVTPDLAARIAQSNFEFGNLSANDRAQLNRDLLMFNNLSASEVANIELQLRTQDRLDTDLLFRVNQAQEQRAIDLQRLEFERLGVEATFQGLELQRRGQMVVALGQDMANQVAVESLVYEEANLNLDRMSTALTQRREEREVQLELAVKRESLITRGGEVLTRLPFAGQLQAALEGVTGAPVDPREFELPTGVIDPNAVARQVIEASDFISPIQGLRSALQQTRGAIASVTGAPLASSVVAQGATDQITEGLNG